MEKKVIRVGSVGLGAIWSGVHAPGIERSPDLQLTATSGCWPVNIPDQIAWLIIPNAPYKKRIPVELIFTDGIS